MGGVKQADKVVFPQAFRLAFTSIVDGLPVDEPSSVAGPVAHQPDD
jgi:hypothetical protein